VDIESYCVATTRRRHLLHVLKNANEGTAICGAKSVRFVGETDQPYGDDWPYCPKCVEKAEAIDHEKGDWWWQPRFGRP
jgi:hypothetical protein